MTSISDRLAARIVVDPETGCHVWQGSVQTKGYAQVHIGGRKPLAHRLAYELTNGPIPAGLHIDHLCRNRRCVNAAHLEAVTAIENNQRANILRKEQTHCKRGHELTPDNCYPRADGTKNCRACNQAGART